MSFDPNSDISSQSSPKRFRKSALKAFLSGRATGKKVRRGMAGGKPGGRHGAGKAVFDGQGTRQCAACPVFRGRERCRSWAGTDLDRTAYGPAFGIVDLMESVGPGEGRSARFERVFCPAAIALAVPQDAVDDVKIGNKGDSAHARAAGAASQGVSLEDFPDQTGPRAAGLPGEIGIVPLAGADARGVVVGSHRRARLCAGCNRPRRTSDNGFLDWGYAR